MKSAQGGGVAKKLMIVLISCMSVTSEKGGKKIPKHCRRDIRGLPYMTSEQISDFLTPSPPVRKFTQPPLLRLLTTVVGGYSDSGYSDSRLQ